MVAPVDGLRWGIVADFVCVLVGLGFEMVMLSGSDADRGECDGDADGDALTW